MFIAVDGPNFSGKTHNITLLQKEFEAEGFNVVTVRGVMDSHPLGKLIHAPTRQYKKSFIVNALLVAAEKFYSFEETISRALSEGKIVISDRHLLSCFAYARLYNFDLDYLHNIYSRIPLADKSFFLDTPVETLNTRMNERANLSHTEKKFSRELESQCFKEAASYLRDRGQDIHVVDPSKLDNGLRALIGNPHSFIHQWRRD